MSSTPQAPTPANASAGAIGTTAASTCASKARAPKAADSDWAEAEAATEARTTAKKILFMAKEYPKDLEAY